MRSFGVCRGCCGRFQTVCSAPRFSDPITGFSIFSGRLYCGHRVLCSSSSLFLFYFLGFFVFVLLTTVTNAQIFSALILLKARRLLLAWSSIWARNAASFKVTLAPGSPFSHNGIWSYATMSSGLPTHHCMRNTTLPLPLVLVAALAPLAFPPASVQKAICSPSPRKLSHDDKLRSVSHCACTLSLVGFVSSRTPVISQREAERSMQWMPILQCGAL